MTGNVVIPTNQNLTAIIPAVFALMIALSQYLFQVIAREILRVPKISANAILITDLDHAS